MVTINKYVYVLLMALFVMGMTTSCNPINKINELKNSILGGDKEQVDEDEEDEGDVSSTKTMGDDEYDAFGKGGEEEEEYEEDEMESDEVFVEKLNIDGKDFSLQVGQTKQLKVKTEPEEYDEQVFWHSLDEDIATVDDKGLVKAVKEGTATIEAYTSDSQLKSSVKATVTPKTNPNYGTVNLGYGTYTGDLKNGQPHGHGTIVYSTNHKIVNSADYVAKRGDKFEADFRDGRVSGGIAYWYHDGDITAINP